MTIGLIVPCYNEQAIIESTNLQLYAYLKSLVEKKLISADSFIAYIDDGSQDRTFEILEKIRTESTDVRLLKLSRNFGHQKALLAGLEIFHKEADALITLDADLQDDISVIETMIKKFAEGNQIVYGIRNKRPNDTFFKKSTALMFYKIMRQLGTDIIYNHADYRLSSKRVLEELQRFEETNLFLRGIYPLLGFQSCHVYYDRQERVAGETKFSTAKMLSFAWDGITSFSIKPLRIITIIGFLVFGISLGLSIYVIVSYLFFEVVHGWASIALPVYFIGGIQLLSIGIVGEYIGKIYKEVKRRPRYTIEKIL